MVEKEPRGSDHHSDRDHCRCVDLQKHELNGPRCFGRCPPGAFQNKQKLRNIPSERKGILCIHAQIVSEKTVITFPGIIVQTAAQFFAHTALPIPIHKASSAPFVDDMMAGK